MSETITFDNGASARIYGSLAGALSYLGSETDAWDALSTDESLQRLLVRAGRYLDRLLWIDDYDTFAERDALTVGDADGDAKYPFRAASYELARLALDDESVLAAEDQGSNIQSMGAGGASITFFSPTSTQRGTASALPSVLMKLVGGYLASSELDATAEGGSSSEGSCVNPFGPCSDFDRNEPW
ncbi:MAG TPA: hypothetical protein VM764_04385 [Gemmatimonadaceae bacterium]|jgi:hypothetical protein|nr:hypothetical protein [Gemmatimonadaceae bacterium]